MNRLTFLRTLILTFSFLTLQARIFAILPSEYKPEKVKYVFLFIGDGMGQDQVNLTQAYLAALEDRVGLAPLKFTQFPEVGFVSTHAFEELITCSAAAGTALATGHKTSNGRISMDPAGEIAYESIATKAKKNGFKVGIVTSVSIDHATPAVFYAHQPDRDWYFEIGTELARSNFDYFAGGGFMIPDGMLDEKPVNLIKLCEESGFKIVNTRKGFEELSPHPGKTLVLSPEPAREGSLPYSIDMGPGDFTLAEFTAKAISMLDNEKGFFLMVEGGKIDWACHDNDAATVIHEVIAFDKAIDHAISFYRNHPEETLIIVTADHETGGLTLGNPVTGYGSNPGLLKYQKSSEEELRKIVAQFRVNKSGDPEADFARMMKVVETDIGLNNQLYNTILSEEEAASLKKVFNESVYGKGAEEGSYGSHKLFIDTTIKLLAEKAGISWGSHAHTFGNVPVYSTGKGSERFAGYIDNTDIPKLISELMGVSE